MRVRDRLTAVVVTLSFALAAPGSAAGPPSAGPVAVASIAADLLLAGPVVAGSSVPGPAVARSAVVPASGCRAGPVASVGGYPQRRCAELPGGRWSDRRDGLAYGDGPDDPLPAAPPRVADPVVPARFVPGPRPPALPLPPRGAPAARAPPPTA
ncbi:hypothetical protein [Micromonospora robiginosa]|uniref:Uncharacterized protein n=1 Tax=Micromonospora robiginosa TaxID=2749844 RepID=A0A7L6B8B2_9ACTN|nr:hypothetical protein [Micromonospora ferruginea]QLQ37760.1 hypothetical protein H1D33_02350 [Micromonospora ferruginea]